MITIDQLILGLFLIGVLFVGFEEQKKVKKEQAEKQTSDFISFKIV